MLTLDFLNTFYYEFKSFFIDFKNTIVDIISSIHNFLNIYLSDDVILVFLIGLAALVAIAIFRAIINK